MTQANQIEIGWLVMTASGPMFWPLTDYAEACSYCNDGAEPVKIYAGRTALETHEAANGEPA